MLKDITLYDVGRYSSCTMIEDMNLVLFMKAIYICASRC